MSSRPPLRKVIVRVIALILALVICAVLYDLFWPRTTHMREFDPDEVARLETAMWRSYYEKQRVRLFNQMTELLRSQYHMTPVKSNLVAYYAAKAAFVFKEGKERADYEKAASLTTPDDWLKRALERTRRPAVHVRSRRGSAARGSGGRTPRCPMPRLGGPPALGRGATPKCARKRSMHRRPAYARWIVAHIGAASKRRVPAIVCCLSAGTCAPKRSCHPVATPTAVAEAH